MKKPPMKKAFHWDRLGKNMEESLSEEVKFHLETRIEQLVAEGRSPDEAREEALRQFGDPEDVVRRCRRIDQTGFWGRLFRDLFYGLLQDIRFVFRSLRKAPGFVMVAVLSLAVGIGVNAAVFTTIHAIWFDPVPGVTDQDRIVDLVPVVRGEDYWAWAYPDFEAVRDADTPFESITAWAERDATHGTDEGGRRARVAYTTSHYFDVLGANPFMGRGFLDSEDEGYGQHPVAVVSFHFWQDRLGGRRDILGHSLVLDGTAHTVIGVAPEGFIGARVNLNSVDLWVPLFQHPDAAGENSVFTERNRATVQVLGRLLPGATLAEARAAARTVFATLQVEYPETNSERTVNALSFGRFPAQNRAMDAIGVIAVCGLFAILLLIICGNLAGVAAARAATRETEISVRMALGASRARLARSLMVEAAILTAIGGAIGIGLAMVFMTNVSPMDLNITAPGATFEPNVWTMVMSLAISFVAVLAFGLLPAVRFSRPELISALRDDAGGGGRRVGRLQRMASSFQTGTAFLLILIAALFFRSLGQTDESIIGFRPNGMAVADFRTAGTFVGYLDLADEGHATTDEGRVTLVNRILESIRSVPGVASAALSTGFPMDRIRAYLEVNPAGSSSDDSTGMTVEYTRATEGFFASIGTPIQQGRGLLPSDNSTSAPVAVISRSFADLVWPGENPLGQQFVQAGTNDTPWTVVGVVGDVAPSVVTEDLPQMFVPLRQMRNPVFVILVRSEIGTATTALAGSIRDAVWSVGPGLPIPRLIPAGTLVSWATQEQRTGGQVAGGIGFLVLILAAMGVYGVVALTVANRIREIGIRIAMGATRGSVIRGVFVDALRMAVPGLLVGGALAVGTAVAMRSTLLGLSPVDPFSVMAAGALLLGTVVASSFGPALQASGVNPMDALRR